MKYLIFSMLLILVSCTEKKKKELINNSEEDTVYILMNILIKKDDILRVYYIPEGKESFEDNIYLESKIIGSEHFQIVKFKFPQSIYLNKIRLDIGEIKQEQSFTINNISFLFEEKCFLIEKDFEYFFKANRFIVENKLKKNSYYTKGVENRYDPHFMSRNLIDIMDFLLYID